MKKKFLVILLVLGLMGGFALHGSVAGMKRNLLIMLKILDKHRYSVDTASTKVMYLKKSETYNFACSCKR